MVDEPIIGHFASERRRNALKSLIELYTVVMGVALSLAVVTVLGSDRDLTKVTATSAMLFVAFLFTLVPFHHGALRHLWDAYLENRNDHIRAGAVVPDFAMLFGHALIFILLALLLARPGQFAWALAALLLVDAIWGLFVFLAASSRQPAGAEWKWAAINFGACVLSVGYLVLTHTSLTDADTAPTISIVWTIGCIARTVLDYALCADFYFPPDEPKT